MKPKIIDVLYKWYVHLKYFIAVNSYDYPKVDSDIHTLELLKDHPKNLVRFGDGEFSVIRGGQIGFQQSNHQLGARLKEILFSDQDNVLIGVPRVTKVPYLKAVSYESRCFWECDFLTNRALWKTLHGNTYCDASVTRPYIRYKNVEKSKQRFDLWKRVWDHRDLVIVEGTDTKLGVNNDLFANAKQIERIICPNKNAFDRYEEIYDAIMQYGKEKLVLIALGPTATVLAYDLSKVDIWAIDIGHIDLEYEWYLRKSESRVKIEGKFVNELADSEETTSIYSKEYEGQIIARIY